jgi:copper chaperone
MEKWYFCTILEVFMEMALINVEGMSCQHCEKAVSGAVGSLPGTSNVKVDLKAGTVSLEYDSASVSINEVRAAIEEAGYTCI